MKADRVAFGAYEPDLPALVNPGLTRAVNVYPSAAGYTPVPSLSVEVDSALDGRPRGSISGTDSAGTSYHFVGDETKLYRAGFSGIEDVTRTTGGAYSASGTAQWHFLQHGDLVIAANPGDDMQGFDLSLDTDFSQLSADAPRARYVGFIGPQMVAAHLISDPYLSSELASTFRYPAIGNPTSWPDPTNPSAALPVQAGATVIQGNGGRIQAVVSGAEIGAIFQERQIVRVEYVGGDVIFQVDRVETTRGLIAPRAAVAFGRRILFLAEDGWRVFDYESSSPIGEQKVNRTFLADFDAQYPDRVSAVLHPDIPVIVVAYPGAGNSGGMPNKLLLWNYKIDRWASAEVDLEILSKFIPLNLTLDDLTGNLDADYPVSFDELVAGFGFGTLAAYTDEYKLASFSGTSLAATLETGDREHAPGRLFRPARVMPLASGAAPTVQIAALLTRASSVAFGSAASLEASGYCKVRGAKGRYHRYRLNLPAGWSEHAVGLDVEGAICGGR